MALSPSHLASRSRPIGPRSPKTLPTGELSSDLTNRLEEPVGSPGYSPLTSASSNTRAGTPDGHRLSQTASHVDAGIQAMATGPEVLIRPLIERYIQTDRISTLEVPVPILASSRLPPTVKKILKPPTLPTPSAVNFDSEPVQWRGMTLEVAQWTFSSLELQAIVATAIRKSAHENFIRLVATRVYEEELSAELERLETVRTITHMTCSSAHNCCGLE